MRAYLCDVDGTVANNDHRQHYLNSKKPKDWEGFFQAMSEDTPYPEMHALLNALYSSFDKHTKLLWLTSRPIRYLDKTMSWLENTGFPVNDTLIYMRGNGDFRPDEEVKHDFLVRIRKAGFVPILVFDNRDKVVKMWRDHEVPCLQVREGAF